MNFTNKLSLLMDLRLLVRQKSTSLFIYIIFFLILLMSCATNVSATSRILNELNNNTNNNNYQYKSTSVVEFNQHNSNNDNYNNNYKIKSSPRILNSIITENTLIETVHQPQSQKQIKNEQKFSQPFNRNDIDSDSDGFRPIKPHGIDQNYIQNVLFTPDGHFRVFEDTSIQSPTTTIAIHKKYQQTQQQPFQQQQQKQQQQPQIQYTKEQFYPILNKPIIGKEIININPTIMKPLLLSPTLNPIIAIQDKFIKEGISKKRRHINSKSEYNNKNIFHPLENNKTIKNYFKNELNELNTNTIGITTTMRTTELLSSENEYNKTNNINPFQELINSKGIQNLQNYILNFIHNTLSAQYSYELFSGVRFETKPLNTTTNNTIIVNNTDITAEEDTNNHHRSLETLKMNNLTKETGRAATSNNKNNAFGKIENDVRNFFNQNQVSINVPRAMETGRLFIFKGLKKLLWPLFIGVQIAKSILLALFLPSILGSLGKIVGKGLVQVSGFNHPSEAVNDLDFRDNSFNMMNDDNKYIDDYSYPRPEASENHFTSHLYEKATNNMNNALSRFGLGDHKKPLTGGTQSMLFMNTDSKNSAGGGGGSTGITKNNKNSYKDFLKVPSSSLLLSNYDPFYSPLLSRIDSVFAQLGIAKGDDSCKEKLVCLMYSHPAKYAPYSNLISAQLSRELNELRKPTSNNEEILRFFKYMKAAKDGQDGVDCAKIYESCKEYQDSDDPVMITTYNDINKLVSARKMLR